MDAVAVNVTYYNLHCITTGDLIRARSIEHSLRAMDSEKPNFHTTKLLTTWWDLVDHYVLVVMFAVSVASVGFQTTQDRLICIPAVKCSDFARNDSVVRRWSEFSDVSDSCNQSSSLVVLTKMSDRRQYDYVDNECYKKMHYFSTHYSLIFLAEAVILLAISNFWQKYPNSASALGHCEHLLLEFTKGDILVQDEDGQPETHQKQAEQKLLKRLKVFEQCYSKNVTIFTFSSVTGQYRLRGVVGIIVTIIALVVNEKYYSLSTGFTQCHLDGHVAFSTKHRFFQCTRSMESYFEVGSILLLVLLGLHLFFVFYSFVWSFICERWGPVYKISQTTSDKNAAPPPGHERIHTERTLLTYIGDAAFLFHFIHKSNYSFLINVISLLLEKEEKEGEEREEEENENTPLTCMCCK